MGKGKLFILSGPSGVGKGTVRSYVLAEQSLNLVFSISMTTRKPRVGEQDGIDYYFVSQEAFDEALAKDEFLEHACFVGNSYGTNRLIVENLLNNGKNVLLEIEVQGAMQVMGKCPDAISIFMIPPSFEELERRIRGRRSEPEDIVKQRLDKARGEMELQSNYNYVVVNDDVRKAADEIIDIIKKCN